ncbi:MAG: nitroreductase family protein [Candidatus Helarchaeota archaeon]
MDVAKIILTRRSVRRFKPDPIETGDLIKILEAARWAPSAVNRQVCRFVAVTDASLLKQIASEAKIVFFRQKHAAQCPAMIVVCCKSEKSWIEEIGAAVQNMLLMAHSLGIGTCWIGAFNRDLVRSVLKIPTQFRIYALILVGYPDETPEVAPRLSLGEIAFLNGWKKPIVAPKRSILPTSGIGSMVVKKFTNKGEQDLAASPLNKKDIK